uniref:Large ribosomal subunit protein bL9m n=2 Tax=Hirondellea gigas TaxID=1518452 RepID=A0A2P2I5Q7_9CRUS
MQRCTQRLLQHFVRSTTAVHPSPLICASPTLYTVSCRSTHVVKVYKVHKMQSQEAERQPDSEVMHKLSDPRYIYEDVVDPKDEKDTDVKKKKRMIDIILLSTVQGIGRPGQVVSMEAGLARSTLLLPKLAAYASPENVEKFSHLLYEDDDTMPSSIYVQKTVERLTGACVFVGMNVREPWTLEPWHIRVAMRKNSIIALSDDVIQLPDEPISGPDLDLEQKFFYVTLTINKREKVRVRCLLHHISSHPKFKLPFNGLGVLDEPPQAILPSQQDYLTELFNRTKIYDFSTGTQPTPDQVAAMLQSSSSSAPEIQI